MTDIGKLVPAHSHWDGINADFEIKGCYEPLAKATGAGTTLGWIPFRAQDSQNYFQLTFLTTGFQLEKRVTGFPQRVIAPTFKAADIPVEGVGGDRMFSLVCEGPDITVYDLEDDDVTRGEKWYSWHDPQYLAGNYISYYTQVKWQGCWDFIHLLPLDTKTEAHDILELMQDARSTGSIWGNPTFDANVPCNGGSTNRGHGQQYGLPHGPNYTFVFDVSGTGTGSADFLDPSPDQHFWAAGYYRLELGEGKAKLKRYDGKTLAKTYAATVGGKGIYTVRIVDGDITLSLGGQTILHVNDGGPKTGIRVRVNAASTQKWVWSGHVT